jgi:hypothetical protein
MLSFQTCRNTAHNRSQGSETQSAGQGKIQNCKAGLEQNISRSEKSPDDLKAELAEVALLEKKGILIPKALVKLQLGYLLTTMRQHILGFVSTLPHKLIGKNQHEMSVILRAESHRLLKDLAQWPSNAVNPDWVEQIDSDPLPTPEEEKDS